MEFGKDVKTTQGSTVTAGAAGTTAVNGSTLDMSGYEAVRISVSFGAIVSGGVQSLKAQQGDLADASDMSDLTGTGMTVADTDDDKTVQLDIIKPTKQYVRGVVSRATQNATIGAIMYDQYNGSKAPVTQGTSLTSETHVSPAEGTA